MKTSLKIASRKFFLVLSLAALLIFSASALFAQQGGGMGGNATPEQRAARQTERMKDQLKLTPAQEPKVLAVNLKYAKKTEDLKKISDTAAQRKSFISLVSQQEAEMKPILTADQLTSYKKMVQERLARQPRMRH